MEHITLVLLQKRLEHVAAVVDAPLEAVGEVELRRADQKEVIDVSEQSVPNDAEELQGQRGRRQGGRVMRRIRDNFKEKHGISFPRMNLYAREEDRYLCINSIPR